MEFTPIDLQKWPRGQMFWYFTKMAPTGYSLTVSCLPWVSFNAFSVQSYENKPYYFPSVEAGKFFEAGEELMMPLSMTCHHAATDGYHITRFLEELQKDMDNFERYV